MRPTLSLDFCSRQIVSTLVVLSGFWSQATYGQTSSPAIEQSATYVSRVDESLTIRKVAVLPVSDNTDGIYARPIEAQINSLVRESHRWDLIDTSTSNSASLPTVSDLEEKPAVLQKAVKSIDADAFFIAAVSRGPNGMSIRLDLFLKKDGKLLTQELLKDHPRTEIPQLREQVRLMYNRLVNKLPYQGMILSRQGNRVTINLGKSDGLKKDQTVSAVQIISVQRHPKFNFLISTDKEILGQIKVLKVDETLSFGTIMNERERGAIARFAKITSLQPVEYGDPALLTSDASGDLRQRPDAVVAFGEKPTEWVPTRPPAFGQVGLRLGLGTYNSSLNISGASPSCCEASSSFYPSIMLDGEIWINPKWIARAEITQGVLSGSNPRSGSSPATVNEAYSRYQLVVGYNFLLKDDFFGPKIQVNAGLATASMKVDDSNPRGITSTSFSGALIGLMGMFPVTDDKIWFVGGKFNLFLFPKLSETPITSGGDPKASINDFSIFAQRKLGENLRAVGSLDFSLYSASYSGAGNRFQADNVTPEIATSLSQRHTVLTGGIIYMF
jgi:hypothetical protein